MGKILSAIGSALRALGRIIWVPCRATGRLIMKVIDVGGSAPAPATQATQSSQRPSRGAEVIDLATRQEAKRSKAATEVRTLAQKMAAGSVTMADMHQVPADVVKWLSDLTHVQLCRVICAEDLDAWMFQKKEIRGLPAYLTPIHKLANDRRQDLEPKYGPPISAPAI